jgi:hypothetical protein
VCAGCHSQIDPIGFGFEHFDQIGAFRADESGYPVDSSGALEGTDVDAAFTDTPELVALLGASAQAEACFARNVYRFASGSIASGPEETWVSRWAAMPPERRTSLLEILVELVRSDVFATRKETP